MGLIHIQWKEIGTRTDTIDALETIAHALNEAKVGNTLVYFEFNDSKELLIFCQAVRMMPLLRDIQQLEEKKKQISGEVDILEQTKSALEDEIRQLEAAKEKRKR